MKRIVNEPTAAALAYGFSRGLDQKVLVYDLGGGTFDVSVLQLSGNVFEVLATGGDTFLGGVDFDNRIIDFVLEEFWRQHKIDLAQSPIAMQRVKKGAEAAKIDLSLIPNVAIDLPYIEEKKGQPLDVRMPLSRQQLNELTLDLVDRTFEICDQVLAERNLRPDEIDEIILVGGQSRMPLVQQKIQEHFGKPPRKGVHPDECVALGAALLGDSLDAIDSVTLVDVLSMPIGIATPDEPLPEDPRQEPDHPRRRRASGCRRRASPGSRSRSTSTRASRTSSWTTSSSARSGSPPPRPGGGSTSSSTRSACSR